MNLLLFMTELFCRTVSPVRIQKGNIEFLPSYPLFAMQDLTLASRHAVHHLGGKTWAMVSKCNFDDKWSSVHCYSLLLLSGAKKTLTSIMPTDHKPIFEHQYHIRKFSTLPYSNISMTAPNQGYCNNFDLGPSLRCHGNRFTSGTIDLRYQHFSRTLT